MVKLNIIRILIIFVIFINHSFAQKDSCNSKLSKIIILNTSVYSSVNTGLYFLWYKDYDQSKFHCFNDANEWLQVDKFGHMFSSYYMSRIINNELLWTGLDKQKSNRISFATGLLITSTIEIYDGFSNKWGASLSDLSANFIGSGLFLFQEEIWKEQKIIPKFSFKKTKFSNIRPDVLGSNLIENILKDYNGQTYWFSININSFIKNSNVPDWINIALGYGAIGILGGKDNNITLNNIYYNSQERERQFYLSLDIALDKIKTKSKFANKILKTFNVIKIPLPTIELKSNKLHYHLIYY